ncbi:MAG: hypothetical protein ACYCVZ_15040 [Streptosporangiaceae bacterium]
MNALAIAEDVLAFVLGFCGALYLEDLAEDRWRRWRRRRAGLPPTPARHAASEQVRPISAAYEGLYGWQRKLAADLADLPWGERLGRGADLADLLRIWVPVSDAELAAVLLTVLSHHNDLAGEPGAAPAVHGHACLTNSIGAAVVDLTALDRA